MVAISLKVNGKAARIDADPDTPLLWLLRDHLGLTGTKYGCGVAQCGACTVHLNGAAVRSCQVRAEDARGASVTTIEGLSTRGDHVLQRLWAELNVPQCGYCQTGMIMAAAELLKSTPKPSRCRNRCCNDQHLPVWHLSKSPRRDPPRFGSVGMTAPLARREFLVSTAVMGGGLALGLSASEAQAAPWGTDVAAVDEFNAWLEIAPDDTVTVRVMCPEIGNGAMTQVAMNVAEELNCAWDKLRVVAASVHRNHRENKVYEVGFHPFFGGHGAQADRRDHYLQIGASARERLRAAAAQKWGVPLAEVIASEGMLSHKSGKRLRFGQIAAAAAKVRLEAEPKRKPKAEWRLLGKASPAKLQIPEMVTGKAVFGIDVKLPGMVHAALMQAPVHGGKLKSHAPEAVLKMPGVRAVVVIDPAKSRGSPVKQLSTFGMEDSRAQWGVAVIADHYWQAKKALDALPVEWDAGDGGKWADANRDLRCRARPVRQRQAAAQERRCHQGRRSAQGRWRIRHALLRKRRNGTAQRDRTGDSGQRRSVVPDAGQPAGLLGRDRRDRLAT